MQAEIGRAQRDRARIERATGSPSKPAAFRLKPTGRVIIGTTSSEQAPPATGEGAISRDSEGSLLLLLLLCSYQGPAKSGREGAEKFKWRHFNENTRNAPHSFAYQIAAPVISLQPVRSPEPRAPSPHPRATSHGQRQRRRRSGSPANKLASLHL